MENTPGTGEKKIVQQPTLKNMDFITGFIISVGSDSNTGPATLLPAGGPEGPDDGTAQTQAADGWVLFLKC